MDAERMKELLDRFRRLARDTLDARMRAELLKLADDYAAMLAELPNDDEQREAG